MLGYGVSVIKGVILQYIRLIIIKKYGYKLLLTSLIFKRSKSFV